VANIDFGQLIGIQSFDNLCLQAFQRLQQKQSIVTNLNEGGVYRTALEIAMQGLADLYSLLPVVVQKGFLPYSTANWTDLRGNELGVQRKQDQKAQGNIIFGRNNPSGNQLIPSGTIVKTDMTVSGDELRYFITSDYIAPDGVAQQSVPIIAEFTGAKYNVGANTIKNIVTHCPGFDYIQNNANWLTVEGADLETDASYIQRTQLRWSALALGSPNLTYKSWALSVVGVSQAEVMDNFPRGNGTVDIVILGTGGLPTTDLITQVQNIINQNKLNCANVLVRAPLQNQINLVIDIRLNPESVLDFGTVNSTATQYVNAYFGQGTVSGVNCRKIGQDFILLQVGDLIKNIYQNDIKNVLFNQPNADVTINSDQTSALQSLAITAERDIKE